MEQDISQAAGGSRRAAPAGAATGPGAPDGFGVAMIGGAGHTRCGSAWVRPVILGSSVACRVVSRP